MPDILELAAPAVRLRLVRGSTTAPRLHFRSPEHARVVSVAERFGLTLAQHHEHWEITAPEGTLLELSVTPDN